MKEITEKCDFTKIKNLFSVKGNIKEWQDFTSWATWKPSFCVCRGYWARLLPVWSISFPCHWELRNAWQLSTRTDRWKIHSPASPLGFFVSVNGTSIPVMPSRHWQEMTASAASSHIVNPYSITLPYKICLKIILSISSCFCNCRSGLHLLLPCCKKFLLL